MIPRGVDGGENQLSEDLLKAMLDEDLLGDALATRIDAVSFGVIA
jgi:hypothetical protein